MDDLASIAYFIEFKVMDLTAKKFITDAVNFFQTLGNDFIERRECPYKRWKGLDYKCIGYKKKYVIAFLSLETEVIVCDFVSYKLLSY